MLMSLTMRLRPTWPPVSWGTTSVVAISNTFLRLKGEPEPRPELLECNTGTLDYTAAGARLSWRIARHRRRGTCLRTGTLFRPASLPARGILQTSLADFEHH